MKESDDLFMTITEGCALEYISDLRFPENRARIYIFLFTWKPQREYALRQWEDLADYLLGLTQRFSSQEEALRLITDRLAG